MYHYKVLLTPPKIDSVVDTNDNIDYYRINRMSKLNKLFNSLYNLSYNTEIPFQNILAQVYPDFKKYSDFEITPYFSQNLQLIKTEVSATNFNVQKEFRYFNDFVLEKVRNELSEIGIVLPDRFKSHYFFESLSDCLLYCRELNIDRKATVIKVEFENNAKVHKMDNRLIADFYDYYTAKDFQKQAKMFLMKQTSAEPLLEIIYQGKYKIISHISLSVLN